MDSRYHQKLQKLPLRVQQILLPLLAGRLSWKSVDLERVELMEAGLLKAESGRSWNLLPILGSSRKGEKEGSFALEGAEASSQ
jgi:hypothetical protein